MAAISAYPEEESMTDFTIDTMIPARRIRLAGLALMLRGIPGHMVALLALVGKAYLNVVQSYGQAMQEAISAHFAVLSQRPRHGLDEDLEGRDPNW
jgi:hypothetical protein